MLKAGNELIRGISRILGESAFGISGNCSLWNLPFSHLAVHSGAARDCTKGHRKIAWSFCTLLTCRLICA